MKFNREKWLAERRQGIGSSDAAAILRMSPWRTPAHVVAEKLEGIVTVEETETMMIGTMLEPVILKLYEMRTGRKPRRVNRIMKHPVHDFMRASLDAKVPEKNIEAKAAIFPRGDWGEAGTDQIPDPYIIQVQHQLAVTGKESADVPVFVPGRGFKIYTVKANIKMQQIIIAEEKEFWDRYIVKKDPMPFDFSHPATLDLVKRLYTRANGLLIDIGPEIEETAQDYQRLGKAISEAITRRDELKAVLLAALGNASIGLCPGGLELVRREIFKRGYVVNPTQYIDFRIKEGKKRHDKITTTNIGRIESGGNRPDTDPEPA